MAKNMINFLLKARRLFSYYVNPHNIFFSYLSYHFPHIIAFIILRSKNIQKYIYVKAIDKTIWG